MDHDIVIRYISALGFPITTSVALGYALYRLGTFLASHFVAYLIANTAEMKIQTAILQRIDAKPPPTCRAACPGLPPAPPMQPPHHIPLAIAAG